MTGQFVHPPFQWITAKTAAKRLGVSVELVNGLAQGKQIRGVEAAGKTGGTVWLVALDDVADLQARMQQA